MRYVLVLFLSVSAVVCCAQSDSIPKKKANHYLGIQANELLRQLFNLSANTGVVTNPYLLNYSVNSSRSGWGLNVGLGYTIDNQDQSDANTTRKTDANNFSMRFGPERKVWIGKKWMTSYGLDFLIDRNNAKTVTATQFNGSNSETDIDATAKASGLGARFTLNYMITPKIILGTECTYYYKAITTSSKITNIFDFNTTITESTQTNKQLRFAVPAVLFLVLKF